MTIGETWTLQLEDVSAASPSFATVASYKTKFNDTLSDIAAALAEDIDATLYDVIVRGRVLTISNATTAQHKDIDAQILVDLGSAGSAAITASHRVDSLYPFMFTLAARGMGPSIPERRDASTFRGSERASRRRRRD